MPIFKHWVQEDDIKNNASVCSLILSKKLITKTIKGLRSIIIKKMQNVFRLLTPPYEAVYKYLPPFFCFRLSSTSPLHFTLLVN